MILTQPRGSCNIELYGAGVRLTAPNTGNTAKKGGGLRGEIGGWSKASRRRMREFLMTNTLPETYSLCACTYTIPGYNLPLDLTSSIWNKYGIYARRLGVACCWRVEVQKRGQLHWHCIAGIELPAEKAVKELKLLWHRVLRSFGSISYTCFGSVLDAIDTGEFTGSRNLMDWPGAEKQSAHVDFSQDKNSSWLRYLHDHTTKSKQEQVGSNIGRHWGKINKSAFVPAQPLESIDLPWKVYSKVLRSYRRLCTPYVRCEGALFGRRRGYTANRGKIGSAVYFCDPRTMKRLVDHYQPTALTS
jgi:hypothetical protein